MVMISGPAVYCHADDGSGADPIMTMQGGVTAIDWAGAVITVNDTTFSFPSNAIVVKGTDIIKFSDIDVGDSVTVSYSRDTYGALRATMIAVGYSEELPQ